MEMIQNISVVSLWILQKPSWKIIKGGIWVTWVAFVVVKVRQMQDQSIAVKLHHFVFLCIRMQCGYRKFTRSPFINAAALPDNTTHCANEASLRVLNGLTMDVRCVWNHHRGGLLQCCFVSRWRCQTNTTAGMWDSLNEYLWGGSQYSLLFGTCVCICAYVCTHSCMWVWHCARCVCAHAHDVYWGQPSLCDQLIKRCTLGWPLVLSPSVVSDLGSAHSPFFPASAPHCEVVTCTFTEKGH